MDAITSTSPVPAALTVTVASRSTASPAHRWIVPSPPIAVMLALMSRSSVSAAPSDARIMSPPSWLATGSLTVKGLAAVMTMWSLAEAVASAFVIVTPPSPSTVPIASSPVLRSWMSPDSVSAASVNVALPASDCVSRRPPATPWLPIPNFARRATVAAVMSLSVSPASVIAPLVVVTWTSVEVTIAATLMSPTASRSISPLPASVFVPSAMVMAPLSAVTSTVAAPPVLMSASCVTPSPSTSTAPLVELTVALMSTVPESAFSVTVPDPWAVTTESIVRSPASTSMSMFPLPASVRTPVPPTISPLVSCTTMSPDVLLVASSVPIVVSISSAAAPPIPSAALNVTVFVVTRLAASPAVLSVIAPVPSPSESPVTAIAPEVLVNTLNATLPVAS